MKSINRRNGISRNLSFMSRARKASAMWFSTAMVVSAMAVGGTVALGATPAFAKAVSCTSTSIPKITSVSPTTAAPTALVVLDGYCFGADKKGTTHQKPYVSFSDDGTSWGAPGDPASLNISWNPTQITFEVPTASGSSDQYATVGDTTASVTVTDGNGYTSNLVNVTMSTDVHWPIAMGTGNVNVAGDGWMNTSMSIQGSGALFASTRIWDTDDPLGFLGWATGFHGCSAITLYDKYGNILGQWANGPFGVEGGQNQTIQWTPPNISPLTQDQFLAAWSVSVYNWYCPQYSGIAAVWNWISNNQSTLQSLAQGIAAAA